MFPGEELGESSPDSVLAPHGFGTQSHAKAQRKKNMMAALDAVPEANLPPQSAPAWDIVSAFAALQSTMEPDPSPAPRQYDFVMPERRLSSNNSGVADFFVWTADGFLCSKQLSGLDIRILEAAVGAAPGSFCKLYFDPKPVAKLEKRPRGFKSTEHLEVLRQSNPCFSSLAPDLTRPSCAEYSYDPLTRFAAMKAGRVPRGVKSTEHLEILRTSNPDYSSLAPDATRPNHTEHSYEPLKRFAAMSVKLPRGFKSTEHLEVLRQSNPCFSSLAPDVTRPNCAEYSYDPLKRFAAMAWAAHELRGAKSAAHLEILRTSDPTYGTLAPSRATARRPQTVKSLDDVGSLARVKSVDGLDGWQCLDRVPASAASQEARHPEHEVAVDVIEWPEEESDEEESDDALPELPWAQQRRRQPRASSTSFDSDGASEARHPPSACSRPLPASRCLLDPASIEGPRTCCSARPAPCCLRRARCSATGTSRAPPTTRSPPSWTTPPTSTPRASGRPSRPAASRATPPPSCPPASRP